MSDTPRMTISAFAMQRGHDRRTITRRLSAAGIKPVSVSGRARYFSVSDMESVMVVADDPHGFKSMERSDVYLIFALSFLGEKLRECVDEAASPFNLSLQKRCVLTVRLWNELRKVVVQSVSDPADGCGVPIEISAEINGICQYLGVDANDENALNKLNA